MDECSLVAALLGGEQQSTNRVGGGSIIVGWTNESAASASVSCQYQRSPRPSRSQRSVVLPRNVVSGDIPRADRVREVMRCALWLVTLWSAAVAVDPKGTRVTRKHDQKSKFSLEELIENKFPRKLSGDINMDPCKSGKSNINPSVHSSISLQARITDMSILFKNGL